MATMNGLWRARALDHRRGRAVLAVVATLAVGGCAGEVVKAKSDRPAPAVVRTTGALKQITVTPKGAERLGIRLAAVQKHEKGLTVPYQAVIYDPEGRTWAYVSPQPGVYLREGIAVLSVTGEVALLSTGPAVGAQVVTTGAAELYGTELGLGS